jgi:CRP/FNR family cyclic AMP-dependent transcriptional regulator
MLTPFQTRARKALAESPFFEAAGEAWLRWARRTALRKGETLFRKGEASEELFGVVSGRIKLCAFGSDGREIPLGQVGPGDLLGEDGLVTGAPRYCTAVALSHCEFAAIKRRDLGLLLECHPSLAEDLLSASSEMTRRLVSRNDGEPFGSIEARVEHTLFEIARRFGERATRHERPIGLGRQALAQALEMRTEMRDRVESAQRAREGLPRPCTSWDPDEG